MKKVRIVLLFMLALICVESCDPVTYKMATPPVSIKVMDDDVTAYYKRNGDFLKIHYEVNLQEMPSNMEIEKVEFFLSNKKIAETRETSYTFEYQIEDRVLGDHELKMVVVADGDGYARTSNTYTITIHIVEEIPVYGFNFIYPQTIENGVENTFSISLTEETTLNLNIDKVSFFFDSESFATVDTSPFSIQKVFSVQNAGIHDVAAKVYFTLTADNISWCTEISEETVVINKNDHFN